MPLLLLGLLTYSFLRWTAKPRSAAPPEMGLGAALDPLVDAAGVFASLAGDEPESSDDDIEPAPTPRVVGLTTRQLAKRTRVTPSALRKLMAHGVISPLPDGRFPAGAVDAVLRFREGAQRAQLRHQTAERLAEMS